MIDPLPCSVRLLPQYFFVKRHDDDVVEVVAKAGVRKHSYDVGEIIQLMLGEELVVQVKAAEDHVYLSHVIVVVRVKRVVTDRNIRPGRIKEPQILEAAGAVDVQK